MASIIQGRADEICLTEALITLVLVWNIVEAIVALQYPSTYVPPQPKGMELTPSKVSSPLVSSNFTTFNGCGL